MRLEELCRVIPPSHFNPFPAGFDMDNVPDHAYFIVHPGSVEAHTKSTPRHTYYGDYSRYLSNLRDFAASLSAEDCVILAIEDDAHNGGIQYPVAIPKNAIRIITKNNHPELIRFVGEDKSKQDINRITSFVETANITHIHFAGEFAWNDHTLSGERASPGYGCLGYLLKYLILNIKSGFDFSSIKGCIFPDHLHESLRDHKLFNRLYDHQT
ncbi:MAG: hypothetical protein NT001_05790 [Candidatus Woesearchaeota archaeon]|nr:hypothetical protein [Candidatus Woesearchaeota archaeon]